MIRFLPAAVLAIVVAATPLAAADEETPATIHALGACRAIADDAARLACYDR